MPDLSELYFTTELTEEEISDFWPPKEEWYEGTSGCDVRWELALMNIISVAWIDEEGASLYLDPSMNYAQTYKDELENTSWTTDFSLSLGCNYY
jgi:hypothetical protein